MKIILSCKKNDWASFCFEALLRHNAVSEPLQENVLNLEVGRNEFTRMITGGMACTLRFPDASEKKGVIREILPSAEGLNLSVNCNSTDKLKEEKV
jgi:hypothetical protein